MKYVTKVECWSIFNDIIRTCMNTNIDDKSKVERIHNLSWKIVSRLCREFELKNKR